MKNVCLLILFCEMLLKFRLTYSCLTETWSKSNR